MGDFGETSVDWERDFGETSVDWGRDFAETSTDLERDFAVTPVDLERDFAKVDPNALLRPTPLGVLSRTFMCVDCLNEFSTCGNPFTIGLRPGLTCGCKDRAPIKDVGGVPRTYT